MDMQQGAALLRWLAGARLSCVLAMKIAGRPVGEVWIAEMAGYGHNLVRRSLHKLLEMGLAERTRRFEGWVLAADSPALLALFAALGQPGPGEDPGKPLQPPRQGVEQPEAGRDRPARGVTRRPQQHERPSERDERSSGRDERPPGRAVRSPGRDEPPAWRDERLSGRDEKPSRGYERPSRKDEAPSWRDEQPSWRDEPPIRRDEPPNQGFERRGTRLKTLPVAAATAAAPPLALNNIEERGAAAAASTRSEPHKWRLESPEEGFILPEIRHKAPKKGLEAPKRGLEPPKKRFEAPDEGYETPDEGFEAPDEGYETPDERLAAPRGEAEPPRQSSGDNSLSLANLDALHRAGIMGKMAAELCRLEHVTPALIQAHARYVRQHGMSKGILICRIRENDPIAGEEEKEEEQEETEAQNRRRYITGYLSKYVIH